ncbi:MAG: motility associated factor glycosyltransferase family protein, partial [Pseudobutyrivibrio sp.]|nr:motility associated factor glycosyltransferase family protein [Pseudobutyrivibrio sp.]
LNKFISKSYPTLEKGLAEKAGLSLLCQAQENRDPILIADILEGYVLPAFSALLLNDDNPAGIDGIYELNLKALSERVSEDVINIIDEAKPRETTDYCPEITPTGEVTIRLEENGQSFYISGTNYPYNDAHCLVAANTDEDVYKYTILGAGLFFEAQVLLEMRADAEVTVIEEDGYLLKLALSLSDVTTLLKDNRFRLVVSSYSKALTELDMSNSGLIIREPSLRHCGSPDENRMLTSYFVRSMTIRERKGELNRNFRKNILQNPQVNSADSLKGSFCDKTVYLIAGGPSLDKTLDFLKDRPDSSVLLSVGTISKKLLNAGIVPDYIIITDPLERIAEQIRNYPTSKTKLLYLCSAACDAVEAFEGDKYALFQNGFNRAEEYAADNGYTLFETGGSVSTTALDLCIRFNCNKIICMGLDLGYTGNRTHASSTLGFREIGKEEESLSVPGVNGDMIPTANNLYIYHKWIERRIEGLTGVEMINISDGAYIKGMKNIPCEQVKIAQYL